MKESQKSKSRNKKGKDAPQNEATADAKKASVATETKDKGKKMADQPSIVEFSESIAEQEPPVPLPVGEYPAEIRGAARKTSQTSGNDYAAVQFYISADAYPADYTEGDPDGMLLTYNRVSLQDTPAARHRIRKFCEAIGAPPPTTKLDLNDWVGRTATVAIQHDTYEGETRAVIGKVVAS